MHQNVGVFISVDGRIRIVCVCVCVCVCVRVNDWESELKNKYR